MDSLAVLEIGILNGEYVILSISRRCFRLEKKLTIKTLQKWLQTSKTTVSFYLNGKYEKMSRETREKIEKVIHGNKLQTEHCCA